MEFGVLAEQNPWWKDKDAIESDYDMSKWQNMAFHWTPKTLENITFEPFSLHILLGPRQVGKTTALKLIIKKLLAEKDPRSIFYFNCEEIADHKELSGLLATYLEFKEKSGIKNSHIFLDEITSPKEWYRAIKSAIDRGLLKNDVLVITGSSSIGIKKHTELFPGRRGSGKDILLLPLSFREYVRVLSPEICAKVGPISKISEEEIAGKAIQAMPFLKELNQLLEKYFESGGFPLAIDPAGRTEAKRAYLSWIKTEVLKSGRSDTIAREIVKSLFEKMQTPVSWEGISNEIEIKSPKTVAAHVHLLRSIFALIVLYHVDIGSGRIKFGKNKKIHAIDPLILEIFADWTLSSLKNKEEILAESLLATHMARYYAKRFGTASIDEGVFYWRNSTEVDVILNLGGKLAGFEAKWTDNFEYEKPEALKEYVIASRARFSAKPPLIPLAVLLAMLDV